MASHSADRRVDGARALTRDWISLANATALLKALSKIDWHSALVLAIRRVTSAIVAASLSVLLPASWVASCLHGSVATARPFLAVPAPEAVPVPVPVEGPLTGFPASN